MTVVPGMNWSTSQTMYLGQITELDMVSAGLSVIKADKLLPLHLIKRLDALPKKDRSIAIGRLSTIPELKNLAKIITDGIRNYLNEFLNINGVSSERIISVKRDAIFITGPCPGSLKLNEHVAFKPKNSYTSFLKLNGVELYAVPKRRMVDIKGIGQNNIALHKNFLVEMILDYLGHVERNKRNIAAETLQQFRYDYVNKKLPLGFYREFNATSKFAIQYGSHAYQLSFDDSMDIDLINILYNLKHVIIPMAKVIS